MRVLVADDEILIRKTLKKVFESKGCEVQICADGLEAITALEKFKPDLVILDVIMPLKGGVEVLKEISNKNYKIIMISAYSAGGTKEEYLKEGAIDFIRKPFEDVFIFVDHCLSFVGQAQ
jgi:CheY-like chemotaxis protein